MTLGRGSQETVSREPSAADLRRAWALGERQAVVGPVALGGSPYAASFGEELAGLEQDAEKLRREILVEGHQIRQDVRRRQAEQLPQARARLAETMAVIASERSRLVLWLRALLFAAPLAWAIVDFSAASVLAYLLPVLEPLPREATRLGVAVLITIAQSVGVAAAGHLLAVSRRPLDGVTRQERAAELARARVLGSWARVLAGLAVGLALLVASARVGGGPIGTTSAAATATPSTLGWQQLLALQLLGMGIVFAIEYMAAQYDGTVRAHLAQRATRNELDDLEQDETADLRRAAELIGEWRQIDSRLSQDAAASAERWGALEDARLERARVVDPAAPVRIPLVDPPAPAPVPADAARAPLVRHANAVLRDWVRERDPFGLRPAPAPLPPFLVSLDELLHERSADG